MLRYIFVCFYETIKTEKTMIITTFLPINNKEDKLVNLSSFIYT